MKAAITEISACNFLVVNILQQTHSCGCGDFTAVLDCIFYAAG
jgi:hypothetical protein